MVVHRIIIKAFYDLYMNQNKSMPKSIIRTYSRYSREASLLLGELIRVARKERKLTAQEVADRAGISRGLLQRIEKGDLKCEIGAVFEVAVIVGVKLFDADETTLTRHIRQTEDKLSLLPKSVRRKSKVVHDDF
ncbi:XRE family transcriptional regulator [Nitrosomonas nitrosa]|uniref:Helix-turn-helix domain-containing protein n=2 Tax=Nitrosomonas nitrosa TaxID=52442 RepID=A0A1I4SJZ2_9PROT|nr:XRE family transcriptional regulator [Nitrosomonas nitrosa]SFM64752.1 Helix-turn-helix domain-containing protein [Nitrosomonas nitrosa]